MTNAELTRRWFNEVWTEGKEATIDELADPAMVAYGLGEYDADVQGIPAFKEFWWRLRGAFPDIAINVVDTISEGDKVACRFNVTMTHLGPQLGFAPTKRKVRITGICIARWKNGKIVEGWNVWDQMGMMTQIQGAPLGAKLLK